MKLLDVFPLPPFTEEVWIDFKKNPIFFCKQREVYYGRDLKIKLPFESIFKKKMKYSFFIQPLGENWLVVSSRCYDERSSNAHIYSSEGTFISSFHAGDGIADVQTTADEKIWVSFYDEGIFSGTSLGASGLICLNGRGERLYEYHSEDLPPIENCHALNAVSSEKIWIHYSSKFPLISLENFHHQQQLQLSVQSSTAFAIGKEEALFCGSRSDQKKLFLFSFSQNKTEKITPFDERGKEISFRYGIGRDNRLFLINYEKVYEFDCN